MQNLKKILRRYRFIVVIYHFLFKTSNPTNNYKNIIAEQNKLLLAEFSLNERTKISRLKKSSSFIELNGFIFFLALEDKLHSKAVKTIFYYINQNSNADIFYFDEDRIDVKGKRSDPLFKPAINPDLLYSSDYIGNAFVIRKTLLEQIEGFDLNDSNIQTYDLLLKAIKICGFERIKHIPYVLLHKKVRNLSEFSDKKISQIETASIQALQNHLADRNVVVEKGELANTFRVRWPLPKNLPLVSIIIPTKNAKDLVEQCISSLYQKTSYNNFEILLVDNQSDCKQSISYFAKLKQEKKVHLLKYNKTFNYSSINNFAARKAKGEILLLLNNDVEVINSNWLDEMVSQVLRPEIGCVGAKLFYPNDTIQHAGVIVGLWGCAGHSHKHYESDANGYMNRLKLVQNYSAVTAACLAVRKDVFLQVEGLNEKNLTVAFNDIDFCLKVKEAGFRNLWTPYAKLYHHESISRGEDDTPEKMSRVEKEISYMRATWNLETEVDFAYSPWLTKDREDFGY